MAKQNYNIQSNTCKPSHETNTRNDGIVRESYIEHHSVNASVTSGGSTPIDITLMTGNNQVKGGEKK